MVQSSLTELVMSTPSDQANAISEQLTPSRTKPNAISAYTIEPQEYIQKRQQKSEGDDGTVVVEPTQSVVHVTITAAGTVIYTQTSTSYSYIESYVPATATPSTTPGSSNNNSNGSTTGHTGSNSKANLGAIIGGSVGGVAAIALLAGLLFFLFRRHKQKNSSQSNMLYDDDDSYYRGHQGHPTINGEALSADDEKSSNRGDTIVSPPARHLVAPLQPSMATTSAATIAVGNSIEAAGEGEGTGRESKYYPPTALDNGYYMTMPYSMPFYSANNSVVSDSMPSSTVEGSQYNHTAVFGGPMNGQPLSYAGFRQVPNEMDYHVNESVTNQHNTDITEIRHVPHLKDDTTVTISEPPHTKD